MLIFLLIMPVFWTSIVIPEDPKHIGVSPEIRAIFPSADTLPENLLRLYIHFSKPMKTIGNLEKIHLKDESGDEVMGAIFNNVHELWNHDQTQLTLLLDPSRVKTGLHAHEQRGRALDKGKRYELVIGELEDVEGRTTLSYVKSFLVGPEDVYPPNTDLWVFHIPEAGSQAPFIIQFPQMLDRLSLLQRLKLTNEYNQPISGKVILAKNETEWHFQADENWTAGDYLLYIHSRLEDPAGNNLNGLFDHKPGSLKHKHEGIIKQIAIK